MRVLVIAANRAYNRRYDPASIRQEEECARRAQKVLGYQDLTFLLIREISA